MRTTLIIVTVFVFLYYKTLQVQVYNSLTISERFFHHRYCNFVFCYFPLRLVKHKSHCRLNGIHSTPVCYQRYHKYIIILSTFELIILDSPSRDNDRRNF